MQAIRKQWTDFVFDAYEARMFHFVSLCVLFASFTRISGGKKQGEKARTGIGDD